jgi:hypothetical protein
VWKCTDGRILKVAWRNEAGTSEPGIYHLADSRPGLARREDGGDVHIITRGHPEVKLDANFIMARLSRQTEFNAVLQHVVLDQIGKNHYGSTPPLKNLRTVSSPLWQVSFHFYHHLSLISPQIFLFYPQVAVIFLKLESYIVTSILETSISGIWKNIVVLPP